MGKKERENGRKQKVGKRGYDEKNRLYVATTSRK